MANKSTDTVFWEPCPHCNGTGRISTPGRPQSARTSQSKAATLVRNDHLLSLQEVASRLGVSYVTVKRLAHNGELRSVRLGDRRLIRESDLAVFIATLGE